MSCWDSEDKYRCIETISVQHGPITMMCYSIVIKFSLSHFKQLRLLIVAGKGNSIRIWQFHPNSTPHFFFQEILESHIGDITSLCLSETGDHLFSGARDNSVRYWDLSAHSCLREVTDPSNPRYLFFLLLI